MGSLTPRMGQHEALTQTGGMNMAALARAAQLHPRTLRSRLERGWGVEEALTRRPRRRTVGHG